MKQPTKARRIVYNMLEAVDPDDPLMVLKSQPGFRYQTTQFMGDKVFPIGPGEDTSDWPWPIGAVVQGPENRWYIIDIRGIPQERLPEYQAGVHEGAKTYDNRDEAALAIWLIWSRLPNSTKGLLNRKRRKIGEAYAGFWADELNSNQPIPQKRAIVYKTLHQPWAKKFASMIRRKYGINVWVDGTVTTGWKLIVHAADADRASRMFKSL